MTFSTGCYVPDNYPTILDAIYASVNGDTIIVRPGTYVENIDFHKKAITVKSELGAAVTIIDGNQAGRVVLFRNGENSSSVLEGFTVTNGYANNGGGIGCFDSSPIIRNNTISGNTTYSGGGGLYCYDSSPTITNNTITNNTTLTNGGGIWCGGYDNYTIITNNTIAENTAEHDGGGIECLHSSPTITNNTISGNSTDRYGGGIDCVDSIAAITNNKITGNSANWDGGGISCGNSNPTIANNNILGNSSNRDGGGIHCGSNSFPTTTNNNILGNTAAWNGGGFGCSVSSSSTISNTILWNNRAPSDPEIFGSSVVTYCDVRGGYPGIGNIDAAPRFVDPTNGDFHLPYDSPCRNAGSGQAPGLPTEDFEGDPRIFCGCVDIGADEFHPHLYYSGTALPGGSVDMKLIAPPTVCACLLRGSGIQDPPLTTPYGDFHLSLPLLGKWTTQSMPLNGVKHISVAIPGTIPPGKLFPFQALVGPIATYPALFTNMVTLTVE